MDLQDFHIHGNDGRLLESLSSLSYRSEDLRRYLHDIAYGVSCLLHSDWSIVTISQGETGQVVASSFEQEAVKDIG